MKKKFILLLFIFGSTLFADDLDMKKLKAMKARAIGPVSYTHLTLPTILLV
mgnify:CR=1 FL=1